MLGGKSIDTVVGIAAGVAPPATGVGAIAAGVVFGFIAMSHHPLSCLIKAFNTVLLNATSFAKVCTSVNSKP